MRQAAVGEGLIKTVEQAKSEFDRAVKAVVDRAPPLTEWQKYKLANIVGGHHPRPNGQDPAFLAPPRNDGPSAGVYFLLSGQYVKIGMSMNVTGRVTQLQTSSPERIKFIAYIPCGTERDRRGLEAELHDMWAELRSHGEWFRATPELIAWIGKLISNGDART